MPPSTTAAACARLVWLATMHIVELLRSPTDPRAPRRPGISDDEGQLCQRRGWDRSAAVKKITEMDQVLQLNLHHPSSTWHWFWKPPCCSALRPTRSFGGERGARVRSPRTCRLNKQRLRSHSLQTLKKIEEIDQIQPEPEMTVEIS